MRDKISIIGAGNVGATTALLLSQKDVCDLVLLDIDEGIAEGKALDMMQAGSILDNSTKIIGTNDYRFIEDSRVVIITAGIQRKIGMSRDDLLEVNTDIMKEVCTNVKKFAPNAILIIVSNPLDAMVHVAKKVTGFFDKKVIGMAGVLDSARFKTFISMITKVSSQNINATVLGGHGDDMVPLSRLANVNGVPITQIMDDEIIGNIEEKTRNGGAEIVSFLKTGSAFYAPSASVVEMVLSIILDQKKILPVCTKLNGEYGYEDIFLGVPAVLGKTGVEKIVEVKLKEDEKISLDDTAMRVKKITEYTESFL